MMMSPVVWSYSGLASKIGGHVVAYALPAHPTWELDVDALRPILNLKSLVDVYASAIERDFRELPVDIVGHSTGGFLALLISAYRPDLVRRVVVISGFADGAMDSRQPLPMRITCLPLVGSLAFRAGVTVGTASRGLFVRASIRSAGANGRNLHRSHIRDAFDHVRRGLSKCDLQALALFVRWLSSASADLSRVTAPVLIIMGTHDPVVPVSHQLGVVRQLRLCQSLVLDGVGHLPMMEAEQSTGRAVRAWLGANRRKETIDAHAAAPPVFG
jgi:pimeloyl-ACP methyl ester carboxylesterase